MHPDEQIAVCGLESQVQDLVTFWNEADPVRRSNEVKMKVLQKRGVV